MNRRTFMMGLFGIAGTAVCAGKAIAGDAVSVPFKCEGSYMPTAWKGFAKKTDEQAKIVEALRDKINDMNPGDVLCRVL